MSRAVEQLDISGGFRVEGIPGLSRKAADFLRRRPREARMAVAAALETAAAQDAGKRRRNSSAEIPESLKPFVVFHPESPDMLGVAQAADRLGLAASTVYNWVAGKKLLGWTPTGGRMTIPAQQILGTHSVVPGIPEILAVIDDSELAWSFLTQKWPFANDVAYPLEKLKNGRVEEVLGVAPAFGMTFS